MLALTVAGAGMAGLAAAARARELGITPIVLEKGDRPGGSMRLASCVVFRHRSLELFGQECTDGDPVLQARIVEELDDALAWLESLGAPVVARKTGNPRTRGWRFDSRGLTDALVRAAGEVRLGTALPSDAGGPVVLATGGFAARLAAERGLGLRAHSWSDGGGLAFARARGAALAGELEEFYGRALPAPPARVGEADFVSASQLYGRLAHVVDEAGEAFFPGEPTWSEADLVQAVALRAGGIAWYVVDARTHRGRAVSGTVAEMVAAAEALGGEVRRAGTVEGLGLGPLRSPKLVEPPFTAVKVRAAVTHTLGGLRIDERARVLGEDGAPLEGLYAAGCDAGGIASGGYASGLAAAVVFGRIAAETAAGVR